MSCAIGEGEATGAIQRAAQSTPFDTHAEGCMKQALLRIEEICRTQEQTGGYAQFQLISAIRCHVRNGLGLKG